MSKKVFFKIYDSRGEQKAENWEDAEFVGFAKKINGGLGPCSIKLGRKFDNYGEYDDVRLNNEVQIWIVDDDTDEYGVLIYSGYISSYEPWIERGREGITVNLLGYYTLLAQDIYKNGTDTTIDESGTDIGTMFRNLMDRYRAETSNPKLHYRLDSIRITSTTGTYSFKMMDYLSAIDRMLEMAPSDWYWYIGANNEVQFKQKASSPTHHFILGRHFTSIRTRKSMEKVKNIVHFYDRNTVEDFVEDDASISDYGRRTVRKIDQRSSGTPMAYQIGDEFVTRHKDPEVKVVAEILDNNESELGYDIESIEPGDTCVFEGFDVTVSETFKYNALITEVEYSLDKAIITIEPLRAGMIDTQHKIEKELEEVSTDVPGLGLSLKYYQSAAQTVTTITVTKVNLQTKVWDNLGDFTNSRFTVKRAGRYSVVGSVASAAVGDGKRLDARIHVNGSAVAYQIFEAGANTPQYRSIGAILDLDVGDYVELYTYHSKGTDVVLSTGEAACNLMIQVFKYD